ncbi:hypothetical protein Pmani_035643 [Petrolisthes manimaculis]|uniref:MI domain-containing protein n=1 Tax=Petrolisthes manimaculis TaxID=1843537 RepID=A0AAE1NLA2_9EUCA|nr:hypothetical protein Pmani_035643 [Petrolisthes manimaculis]
MWITNSGDDGWNMVANTKGRTSLDSARLKNTFNRSGTGDKEVTLGGTGFSSWARSSSGGVATDRSKSTSRPESRDNSVPRESEALKVHPPMDSDTAEKLTVAIIDEYTHNCDPDEAKLCIKEKFASSTIKHFVQFSLEWVLDRDSKKRRMVGQLLHDLIVENLLSFDQLVEGSHEILAMTEDFEIDIPKVCNYLGEIFAPCLNDNAVTLKRLLDLTKAVGNNKKANVFACIVSQAAQIMGPNKVADIWNSSGLKWSDIVPSNTDQCSPVNPDGDKEVTLGGTGFSSWARSSSGGVATGREEDTEEKRREEDTREERREEDTREEDTREERREEDTREERREEDTREERREEDTREEKRTQERREHNIV